MRNFGRGTWDLPSFGRAEYGGVKLPAWWEAPPKIGGCSRCARPAGTLAAEKNVLAGGAGQNMIGSFSAGCGRRNSARRALPGESVERKGGWGPSGFLRAAARTCWVCPTGRVDGAEGGWIPYREAPTPKAFPSGGRCPSARTGADEGAIDSPNGTGEGGRKGDRSLLLQGKVGYRIAPSSVTFGDSFPPKGKPS